MKEEVSVAAWEEPCRRGALRRSAERRFVARQDPRVADGCSHRSQRSAEPVERRGAVSRGDTCPLGESLGRRWPEDVKVPTRELEASAARIDRGRRNGPHGRRSRALPPDQDCRGGCGVPEAIWVYSESAPRLAVGHPPAFEVGV